MCPYTSMFTATTLAHVTIISHLDYQNNLLNDYLHTPLLVPRPEECFKNKPACVPPLLQNPLNYEI